jgi:hypothetical protein
MTTPDETPTIDAVPTDYRGTTFRSRLEADWATTLDANHIEWTYEPETITLPSGATYIPDFWLPELGTWIEVKGPGIPRVEKTIELAELRACHCDGDCTCRWPGGELVILGRTALPWEPGARGHQPACGYANWETPFGPSAYCIGCPGCGRTQWITLRRPWRCRVCRFLLEKQPAHRGIDRRLRFAERTPDLGPLRAAPDLDEPFPADEWQEDLW